MNFRERIEYLLKKYEFRQTGIDEFTEVYV
jgi:hypothetical protein